MDREAVAANLRCVYAYALPLCRAARSAAVPSEDAVETALAQSRARSAEKLIEHIEGLAKDLFGPSFSFEPDMQRRTDAAPARQGTLRLVPSAPKLAVIPGGGAGERPSDRFIDDDAPRAG